MNTSYLKNVQTPVAAESGVIRQLICACLLLLLPLVTSVQAENSGGTEIGHGTMKNGEMKHGDMKDGDSMDAEHSHSHQLLDVSGWASAPSISMQITKDAMSGWNIQITPKHFTFTPESVNTENVEGEGHAHLYVNEKKVARLYGSWYHLPALPPGRHSVKVQLNANDHSTLAVGLNPIENITIVTEK